jgi:hypothetical protein
MHREFQDIAEDLRSDGALRDFYIHGTSRADWNAVVREVRSRLEPDCFIVDGNSRELPSSFDEIVTGQIKTSHLWAVQNQPLRGEDFISRFFGLVQG